MLGVPKPSDSAQIIDRIAERKRLTIAAGILCSDGIVLCADSEESDYVAKYQAQKIRSFERKLLVTGAGSGPYLDMTFDKLCEAFVGQWPTNAREVRSITENVISDVYENHIQKFAGLDKVGIDLVVAARCKKDELALVGSCGTATYLAATTEDGPTAGGMVVAGAGRPLFEYWARLFNIDDLTSDEVAYLSLFIIREVKNNVPGCGGSTYAARLPKDPATQIVRSLNDETMLLGGFPKSAIEMLLQCMDLKTTDDEAFERMLTNFTAGLRSLRSAFKQQNSRIGLEVFRKLKDRHQPS